MTNTSTQTFEEENDFLRGEVQDLEDKLARLEAVIESARCELREWAKNNAEGCCPSLFEKEKL